MVLGVPAWHQGVCMMDRVLPTGAMELARLLSGQPDYSGDLDFSGWDPRWRELANQIVLLPLEDRRRKASELIAMHEDGGQILDAILDARRVLAPAGDVADPVPPIPSGALLDPGLAGSAAAVLDDYIQHAAAASPMTPRLFHESAALWLVSTAIARRIKVNMPFGPVFPNLFIAWIAPTTLYRKTTALDVAARCARQAFPHLVAAEDTTTEALIAGMAGDEPVNLDRLPDSIRSSWAMSRRHAAQRGWVIDELSGTMARAGKDYNAGWLETILKLYDCDEERRKSTRGQGMLVVRGAYLSILAASTPEALGPYLARRDLWDGGWWARFALLAPEADRPAYREATNSTLPERFLARLAALGGQLPPGSWPDPPSAVTAVLDGAAAAAFGKYHRATSYDLLPGEVPSRLHGTYGRLAVQSMKVATCLAALEWEGGTLTIGVTHMCHAQAIVESWRRSAHRVEALAGMNEYERIRRRISASMRAQYPNWTTTRDLLRAHRDLVPDVVTGTLRQMCAAGEVDERTRPAGPRGGRPTTEYRLAA